jgi:4-amino-4-deoxy-L-arabinose transferase-like glycosyltransferase
MNKAPILFVFVLSAALLRIPALDDPLYADENAWAIDVSSSLHAGMPDALIGLNTPHPPLGLLSYKLSAMLLGEHIPSFRIVPLLYYLLASFFVYKLANMLNGARAALFSIALFLFPFWGILASVQVDIDGAILLFFLSGAFYFFLHHERGHSYAPFLSGLFLGLALLTKTAGILGIVTLGLYAWIRNKSLYKAIRQTWLPFSIGIGILLVFAAWLYTSYPETFSDVFLHSSSRFSFIPSFVSVVYLLLWGTPLLLGLAMLSIKARKQHPLPLLWLAVPVVFYLFAGVPFSSPYDRYLMVIIPAFAIVGGSYLSAFSWTQRHAVIAAFFAFVFVSLFYVLNPFADVLEHNLPSYASRAFSSHWNFFLPFTGSSGPTMLVSFLVVTIAFIVAFSSAAFALFRPKKTPPPPLMVFLGVGIALNIFMIGEFLFAFQSPDIAEQTEQAIAYLLEEGPQPTYTNLMALSYSLGRYQDFHSHFFLGANKDDIYLFNHGSSEEHLNALWRQLQVTGGKIVVLDYPPLGEQHPAWQLTRLCQKEKDFSDKGYEVVEIFSCEPRTI